MRTFLPLLFLLMGISAQAQDAAPPQQPLHNPPVNTEFLFGGRGMANQNIIIKKMQSIPKLGFFSITYFTAEWNTDQVSDYMLQGNLSYQLFKGFDLTAGFHFTHPTGIRPSAGIMYSYANPTWLLVVAPRAYIDNAANIEGLALLEYKPKLSDKWKLYSRFQGNYNLTAKGSIHDRSYIWLRAGLSYNEFTFGAGANFDYYGPMKHNENNVGAFISANLF